MIVNEISLVIQNNIPAPTFDQRIPLLVLQENEAGGRTNKPPIAKRNPAIQEMIYWPARPRLSSDKISAAGSS